MFRVGLIAYLTVATFAGPSLCCCTLGRIVTYTLDSILTGRSEQGHSCCCTAETTPKENSEEKGKSCPTDPDDCPCKEKGKERTALPPVDRVEITPSSFAYDLQDFASVAFVGVVPFFSTTSIFAKSAEPAFLPGQDILLAFQQFRC